MGGDQIVLVALVVLTLAAVFASNLKHAIIVSGVCGLWCSLTYLLYHAPDVAVSEAVVASTLGTVLLILTIRNYADISVADVGEGIWRRRWTALFLAVVTVGVLLLLARTPHVLVSPLHQEVLSEYVAGGGVNPVTMILFKYRALDTVLEALMLLVAVLGVVHLVVPRGERETYGLRGLSMAHPTMTKAIQLLTPIIIVVAVALIIGDPNTPGGGFQGGGLLAAVIVSRYLIHPVNVGQARGMEALEKLVFVAFAISVAAYILLELRGTVATYAPFMVVMNGLLGIKVFCGLGIMFLYFAGEDSVGVDSGGLEGSGLGDAGQGIAGLGDTGQAGGDGHA
ncbi:MAG: DUF4040 domain-containing protein [Cellulomonadaceae bacterium]|jgi:multicomponent Na+:H+ antiporter subunit B|nr:DUF4040 domain-containing protein [Cellulomonadaceae bacterium]